MNGQKDIDNLIKIVRRHGGEWSTPKGIPVMIGKRDGITVDAGFGKVWVRFANGQELAVLNNGAPLAFDWHATIDRYKSQPRVWRIREIRQVYNETPPSFIQAHEFQHELGGFDQLNIDRKLVLSATAFVADPNNFLVRVFGGPFPTPSGWMLADSTNGDDKPDLDLSSYIPVSGAHYVNIETDDTGALVFNSGATVEALELLNFADIPVVPAGNRMICSVMLYESQPKLLNEHIFTPGLFMPDYAAVETGYQIDNAPVGTPVNPDKFGFFKVSDGTLRFISWEDLLASVHDEPHQYRQFVYDVIGDDVDILTDSGDALYDLRDLE